MTDAPQEQGKIGLQPFTVLLLIPDHMQGDECCAADYVRRVWVWAKDPDQAEQLAPAQCVETLDWHDICEADDLAIIAVYSGHIFDLYQP